jgi:hypothetical protein
MISSEIQDETVLALLHLARVSAKRIWIQAAEIDMFRLSKSNRYVDLQLGATLEQWRDAVAQLVEHHRMASSLRLVG